MSHADVDAEVDPHEQRRTGGRGGKDCSTWANSSVTDAKLRFLL